jgi:hypothetical protein
MLFFTILTSKDLALHLRSFTLKKETVTYWDGGSDSEDGEESEDNQGQQLHNDSADIALASPPSTPDTPWKIEPLEGADMCARLLHNTSTVQTVIQSIHSSHWSGSAPSSTPRFLSTLPWPSFFVLQQI